MTKVSFRITHPSTGELLTGRMTLTPRHAHTGRPIIDSGAVVSGSPIVVELSGEPVTIDLRGSGPGWRYDVVGQDESGWRFSESVRVPMRLPDGTESIDYGDLERVDPRAGGIPFTPDPAWWAVAREIQSLGGIPGESFKAAMERHYQRSLTDAELANLMRGAKGDPGDPGRDGETYLDWLRRRTGNAAADDEDYYEEVRGKDFLEQWAAEVGIDPTSAQMSDALESLEGESAFEVWKRVSGRSDATEVEYVRSQRHTSRIQELAARDGWAAVYDPTDRASIDVDSQDRITALRDSLGNLSTLTPTTAARVEHRPGDFGLLDGMAFSAGRISEVLSVTEPVTLLALVRPSASVGTEVALDMGLTAGTFANDEGDPAWGLGGAQSPLDHPADGGAHVLQLSQSPESASLAVDQQAAVYKGDGAATHRTLVVGASNGGSSPWRGSIGPVLVYRGTPDQDVLDRMHAALYAGSSVRKGPHRVRHDTVAFSVSQGGNPTLIAGNPDRVANHGVASITKLMTLWTARQHLSDSDMGSTVTVTSADYRTSGSYEVGESMTYMDAFYASMLPSDNTMPTTIARTVGEKILAAESGSGSGFTRFIEEMNSEAQRLGYAGAEFSHAWNFGKMSARQVADLQQRAMKDQVIRQASGARTHTVQVLGPQSRSVQIRHTIDSAVPYDFPEFIAGKTGTYTPHGHVVATWEHPDGTEHTTVILDTNRSFAARRYEELAKVMVATSSPGHSVGALEATTTSGVFSPINGGGGTGADPDEPVRPTSTGNRDISSRFPGIDTSGSGAGIYLERSGDTVMMSIAGVRLSAGFNNATVLPVGFRPRAYVYGPVSKNLSPLEYAEGRAVSTGRVLINGNAASDVLRGALVWITGDDWPTALPGIPA